MIENGTKMLKYSKKLVELKMRHRPYSMQCNQESIEYCTNIVKQHDHENFMATLLMTKALRTPALVVRAFNVEVARVSDLTSDATLASARLQFWRDIIKSIYKKDQNLSDIPAHPIAKELFKVCMCYKLSQRNLEKLVTARDSLLKRKQFQTLEDIENYAENTVSTVYYMLLSVAGAYNIHADHVASHLGKAQGLSNMLRSLTVHNTHKVVALPMDLLMKHKISQESVLRGGDSDEMRSVVFEMASQANNHLKKARAIDVPSIVKQIFLPASAVDTYLTKLEKYNFNVYDKHLEQSNGMLPLSLYLKRMLNKY